jgi:hypothetical protein
MGGQECSIACIASLSLRCHVAWGAASLMPVICCIAYVVHAVCRHIRHLFINSATELVRHIFIVNAASKYTLYFPETTSPRKNDISKDE